MALQVNLDDCVEEKEEEKTALCSYFSNIVLTVQHNETKIYIACKKQEPAPYLTHLKLIE